MNNNNLSEINRLNFEDLLWFIFALLCFFNIYGDYDDKQFIRSNNSNYKIKSDEVFIITLVVTLIIYLYFFQRNYRSLMTANDNDKNLYKIKLLGSSLLIGGVICLLYFQIKDPSFNGSPAL